MGPGAGLADALLAGEAPPALPEPPQAASPKAHPMMAMLSLTTLSPFECAFPDSRGSYPSRLRAGPAERLDQERKVPSALKRRKDSARSSATRKLVDGST